MAQQQAVGPLPSLSFGKLGELMPFDFQIPRARHW
jgi:hypothetical protein